MASTSQFVIEHYLRQSLGEEGDSAQLLELRTDILYLLTDRFAHRRALRLDSLVEELHRLQHPELALSSPKVAKPQVRDALELLCKRGIVRRYEGEDTEYELAHDFLVRSVLKAWKQLDRERVEQAVILRQERERVGERLAAFDNLSNAVLRILPVTTIATYLYVAYVAFWSTLPSWLGIAVLWVVVCQALLILFVGLARKTRVATAFGLLSMIVCGGIWIAERSLPPKLVSGFQLNNLWVGEKTQLSTRDLCYALGYSIWISTGSSSSASDFEKKCEDSGSRLAGNDFCSNVETIAERELLLSKSLSSESGAGTASKVSRQCATILGSDERSVRAPSNWPRLRSYQMGELETFVAWISLVCCMLLAGCYPNILLHTLSSHSASRYIAFLMVWWHELLDVVLQLIIGAILVYIARSFQSDGTLAFWSVVRGDDSWREVLPNSHPSFWMSALAAVVTTAVISSAFVLRKHKTPAGLITGVGLEPRSQWSIARAFARQLCFSIWTCLNAFLLLPSLIITPIFLVIRGPQQTICDWMTGFTEVLPPSSHAVTKTVDRPNSATAV